MSEENVELVRQLIDAYNRRDVAFIEERVRRDATMVTYEAMGLGDVYTGPGGVRRYFRDAMAWENIQVKAEGLKQGSNGAVVFWGKLCSTGGASGIDVDADLAWVVGVKEGMAASLRVYETRAEAFEAAGLSE